MRVFAVKPLAFIILNIFVALSMTGCLTLRGANVDTQKKQPRFGNFSEVNLTVKNLNTTTVYFENLGFKK